MPTWMLRRLTGAMLLAFAYVLRVVMRNRRSVRERLERRGTESRAAVGRVLAGVLARTWHLVVIAYFAALALVTITRPEEALPFMVGATLKSLVVIALGLLAATLLGQRLGRPLAFSGGLGEKVPGLEARLNAYIPRIVSALRLVILALVVAVVLDVWDLVIDLEAWLASDAGARLTSAVIGVAFIVLGAMTLYFGEDKAGDAPPANLRLLESPGAAAPGRSGAVPSGPVDNRSGRPEDAE